MSKGKVYRIGRVKSGKKNSIYKTLIVIVVIFLLWFILSELGIFSEFIFPKPAKVFKTFISMVKSGEIFVNLGTSILRVLIGFVISCILAIVLGILSALQKNVDGFYRPVLNFMKHIPPMSLIPLLILWFGIGEVPKIIVIVLTSFFPIFMNTEAGIRGCDKKLLEVGKTLHMSRESILFQIQLPAAIPEILTGMQIGLSYAWRAIVGAEMIAAASGIGYFILDAQAMSRTDKVLIGIIMIGIMGLLMDKLFHALIKKTGFMQEKKHE